MTRLIRSRSEAPVNWCRTTTSPRFGSCRRYDSLLTKTRSSSASVVAIDVPSTTKWASTNVRTRNATSSATAMTMTQSSIARRRRPTLRVATSSPSF